MKILLYGTSGWIGNHIYNYLIDNCKNINIQLGITCCDNINALTEEILNIKPDRIICSVGRAYGRNIYNTSYNEDKLYINIRDNLISQLNLSIICNKYNIHCTFVGSDCTYKYENRLLNENDKPTLITSNHSIVKSTTDLLIQNNNTNCLQIKFRYPISGDYHPKCLLSKIISYNKIINVNTSVSYIPELIPILVDLNNSGYLCAKIEKTLSSVPI